jgi:hypothetical protein
MPQARIFAVMGMHRSGTSWLAGSLEERGLALGEVNESAKYNAKGNRENSELQSLHAAVLRDSGGTWRDIPKRVTWSPERADQLRLFIKRMSERHDMWGFKDPRTLIVLDEWLRQVPDLAFVGIYRHPEAVVSSLANRDFAPVERRQAVKLWCAYNSRLVDLHRRSPFTLLRFDAPPEELRAGVDAVARGWSLPKAEAVDSFFSADLVHERGAEISVPRSCRRIWKYLVEHTRVVPTT